MTLAQELLEAIAKERQAQNEAIKEDYEREQREATQFVSILENYGFKNIWNNGYAFHAERAGRRLEFVNQETRLCGDAWDLPVTEDEKKLFADPSSAHFLRMRDDELGKRWRFSFRYKETIVNSQNLCALLDQLGFEPRR